VTDLGRSNARFFLTRLRDHYVDQLRAFLAEQRRTSARGESEVKIELEPGSPFFHSVTCADFVRNDGEPEIVEFTAGRVLGFQPVYTKLGRADLTIETLRWDDVIVRHNGSFNAEQVFDGWFDKWLDPNDRRYRTNVDIGNVVHALAVEPQKLTVDFGSAAPDAFWELLNLLEGAGATEIAITGSPVEAQAS
jgi:hypothetical protein